MTVGSRGLSVPHGEVFPVCVVGAQEGDVLIVSIKQHFFNLHDRLMISEGKAQKMKKKKEKKTTTFITVVIFGR